MSTPPPTPNRRIQRVSEQVRRELSEIIRREFNVEHTGLLTVNEVRTAPDLRTAVAYIGFVGTAAQRRDLPDKLHAAAPRLQILLGGALRLKWTPVLSFVVDESIERGNRVLAVLEDLERQSPPPGKPAA
ncbi:MAG: 30S ribosome-binding factor RbfA [Verrucomicrobia bacterium]|nr:MAG: 30S ribosome-binding factor RbfA [Verrucomicrobiota bacterium]